MSFNRKKTFFTVSILFFICLGLTIASPVFAECFATKELCKKQEDFIRTDKGMTIINSCIINPASPDKNKPEYCVDSTAGKNIDKGTTESILEGIAWAVAQIIGWLCYFIHIVLGKILIFLGGLLDVILSTQQFISVAMVGYGWAFIRDLCNLFFILIILVIAFATILRIESYGIKKLLPKLIIAALLINFSLLICGLFTDFSQIAMATFMPSGSFISEQLARGAYIETIFGPSWNSQNYTWDILAQAFFGLIVLFVACLTFGVITIMLIIRIIALWILCIFAPIAWLTAILPATVSYSKKWWDLFIKYLIYGPAVAFGLKLVTYLINSGSIEKQVEMNEATLKSFSGTAGWLGRIAIPMLNYVFIIVLLFIVMTMAKTLGMWGAGAVAGWGTGISKWGGRAVAGGANRWAARGGKFSLAGGRVGKWMTGKLDTLAQRGKGWERATDIAKAIPKVKRSAVSLFSPTTWKRWSADRKARAEYRAFDEGPGKDTLEALTSGRLAPLKDLATGKANYYSNQAKAREADKKAGEFDKIKDNEKLSDMYWRTSDPREKEGALRVLAKRGAIENELFKGRQNYNPEALQKHFKATFGDEEAARIHADIKAMLIEQGNVGVAGGSKYDKDKHETILVQPGSDDERNIIVEEFSRRPAERSMGNLTKGSIFTLNEKGEPIDIHFQGQTIINSMSDNHISQVKEMREDLLRAMHDHAELIASIKTDDKDKINKLIEKVKNQYEHGGKAPERPSTGGPTIITPPKYGPVR